jgi:hypothetical protein
VVLIGDERAALRVEIDGVGALALVDVPVVVDEQAHLARDGGVVTDTHSPDQRVTVEVHRIRTCERQV